MGSVYRAIQQPLGRRVAIKALRVQGLSAQERRHRQERFFREAAFSSRLNHQHTVTVYDYGELPDGEGFFIAMELLDGQTLSSLIRRNGSLTVAMTLHIATQIASSLADAHAAGVIHRDLKPPNVMLVERGSNPYFVKVVDFGLVKETAATSRAAELTGAQTILGSPMYMAPERFLYHTADTPAVDIYALGVLMYEMLVGRPPFLLGGDVTLHHVMMQHIKAPPPPMRELKPTLFLPSGLESVITRCLEKEPQNRYASMNDLLIEISEYQRNNRLLRTDPDMSALPEFVEDELDVTADSIPVFVEREFAPPPPQQPIVDVQVQHHARLIALAMVVVMLCVITAVAFYLFGNPSGDDVSMDGQTMDDEIPESVAKRLRDTPRPPAGHTPIPEKPQTLRPPDVGPCQEDWKTSCSNELAVVDAYKCLAADRSERSSTCLNYLIGLERTGYKGILLRDEANSIPSVRTSRLVEQLLEGQTDTLILCRQGDKFKLDAARLDATTSSDQSIAQISGQPGAKRLSCFSPGRARLNYDGRDFDIFVGVDDEQTREKFASAVEERLEKCVLANLEEVFQQTLRTRIAFEKNGKVVDIQRLDGNMPIKSEACGIQAMRKARLPRSNNLRVIDFEWKGTISGYTSRMIQLVSSSKYQEARKMCEPLVKAGIMIDECMPLSKDFPSIINDGCNLLGDSSKALFNCKPSE